MELLNPWENIKIEKIDSSERVHNFDGKIHIIYVLKGSIVLKNDSESIIINAPGFYILPKANSYMLVSSYSLAYDIAFNYIYKKSNEQDSYSFEFIGDSRKGGLIDSELIKRLNNLLASYYLEKKYISGVEVFNIYFNILSLLEKKYYKELPIRSNKTMRHRLEEIKFFLDNNFNKNILFKDIAKEFYVSEQYLSRVFTEIVGKSMSDYLLELRIKKVEKELIQSNHSITSIVYDAGFSNVNSFNRTFKKIYGMSPSVYRRKYIKLQEIKVDPIDEDNVKELKYILRNIKSNESKSKTDIDLKKDSTFTISKGILNVGNFGHLLSESFDKQLATFDKNHLFKYVRFTSIFNEEFIHSEENHFKYIKVENVLRKILDRGWTPFIVLNPPERDRISDSTCKNEAYPFKRWVQKIKEFLLYFLNIFGNSELNKWKIEVSKPKPWYYDMATISGYDTFDDSTQTFDLSLNEDYVSYYQSLCNEIKPLLDIQVGLGGVVLEDYDYSSYELIKACKHKKITPDFLGVSALPYSNKSSNTNGKSSVVKSSKENYLTDMTKNLVVFIEENLMDIDLFLTEFNMTSTSLDKLNDMSFKGLYILNNFLNLSHYYMGIGYWLVSDLSSNNIKEQKTEFYGESGLITTSGIHKIGFFAFEFLSYLGDRLLLENENIVVTKNKNDEIVILAFIYSGVDSYYFNSYENYDIQNNELIFGNQESKTFSLQFSNLPIKDGYYYVNVNKIGYLEGNALDESLKVTSLTSYDKETIDYLKTRSNPTKYLSQKRVRLNTIDLDLRIEPQQIVCIKLKRVF